MDLQRLKDYLKSIATSGLAVPNLDQVADAAIESGFSRVWGAYPWSVRRGTKTLSTVASQAHTVLPDDFESLLTVRYVSTVNPWNIDIVEESVFDEDHPNPVAYLTSIPVKAKVVYNGPQKGDRWRLYWYPVPSTVYTMELTYNRRADPAVLPDLPTTMLDAVMAACSALMRSDGNERLAYDQIAKSALDKAIAADRPVTGVAPRWGADPGWDDWDTGRRGSTVWNPHSP